MAARIINPILPGFYPDPSICEAGGYYYLVCSSFSYLPGLPVFKSKNLVTWEQIGNVIDRPEQLDFTGAGVSRGLFAPTIRFHGGKFYCICTQVDKIGNFFVTADRAEGPWSNPVVIEGAEGIDPSLFFDDDGTSWYIGTRPAPEGPKYEGNWEIWIQKIDLSTGRLYGESKGIWRGALRDCVWPEGPHIYKINGMYYLIHAEGGTGNNHAVCVACCETIDGEWIGKPSNPILTHRHLGNTARVRNVGHADLVCADNKWWLCCLASRPYGEAGHRFCNMGRETFLVPVIWEDGWPVASWETGLVENAYSLSGHVVKRDYDDADAIAFPAVDDFNSNVIAPYWLSLRRPASDFCNCKEESGVLRIYGGEPVTGSGNISMLLRRQTGFSYEASARLEAHFDENEDTTGIILFQNESYNYRLQIVLKGKIIVLQLVRTQAGEETILAEEVMTGGRKVASITLRVVAEHQKLRFEYGPDERNMSLLAENIDASILSTDVAGGFVGTVVGMFAVSGGDYKEKKFFSDFDWFRYENSGREWFC